MSFKIQKWFCTEMSPRRQPLQKETRKKMQCCKFCFLSLAFFFLGLHLRHVEIPRWGVKSELQLQAYTTATATQDPSHICHLHHSSPQRWILNPPTERGQGSNRHPHGYWSDLLLLRHTGAPCQSSNYISWAYLAHLQVKVLISREICGR